jgi:hypothetical protein
LPGVYLRHRSIENWWARTNATSAPENALVARLGEHVVSGVVSTVLMARSQRTVVGDFAADQIIELLRTR